MGMHPELYTAYLMGSDQHMRGMAIAKDEAIMGWLFGRS